MAIIAVAAHRVQNAKLSLFSGRMYLLFCSSHKESFEPLTKRGRRSGTVRYMAHENGLCP